MLSASLQLAITQQGFPGGSAGKESACNAEDTGDLGSVPVLGEIWKRKWQPTPVVLPGKSQGQRSLVSCSPKGRKKLGMTEVTEHGCGQRGFCED